MMTTRYRTPAALLVTVAILAGCAAAGETDTDTAAAPVRTSTVRVVDNAFDPPDAEVAAGDTVTWQWAGSAKHNVVGDGFESPVQDRGTYERRFPEPGTYAYRCTLHSGMEGTVTVVAADAGGQEG